MDNAQHRRGRWALTALLMLAAAGSGAAETTASLPAGWQPLALPTLSGNFRQAAVNDTAVLVKENADGAYGLAVVPTSAGAGQARIVKTFHDIKANPPQLSLVKPGTYKPVCHGDGACQPLNIANDAIGLCFGEASCEIIYYDGSAFVELAVTD